MCECESHPLKSCKLRLFAKTAQSAFTNIGSPSSASSATSKHPSSVDLKIPSKPN